MKVNSDGTGNTFASGEVTTNGNNVHTVHRATYPRVLTHVF